MICKRLLKLLSVPFTPEFLKEKILTHPQHPSLLSISVEGYGVESVEVKLGPDRLDDFPLHGIMHISQADGSYFNVITPVSEYLVSLFDEKGKQKKVSRFDFLKSWTGVGLLVEAGEDSAEPGINQKIFNKRITNGVVMLCVLSLQLWLVFGIIENGVLELHLFYFSLKLLSMPISGILLWYHQFKENLTLQKFDSEGKSLDFNSVLDSKAFQWLDEKVNPSLLTFAYFFAVAGLFAGLAF